MFPALMAMSRLLPVGSPAFRIASRLILFLWDRINSKIMYCFLLFISSRLHHIPFEKQLTAFLI